MHALRVVTAIRKSRLDAAVKADGARARDRWSIPIPEIGVEEAGGSLPPWRSISKREGKTMRRVNQTVYLGSVLTAMALWIAPAHSQDSQQVKPVFEHVIPNVDGKRMVAVVVTYPPGGKSPSHHHAPSAFIYAYVLSGAIRSQVGDEPARVYQAGESFFELPGSHHRISENASDRDPASLLAVFVVDSKDNPLTTPDEK
jgi:quercetin dioxygenase-like cupin family protein